MLSNNEETKSPVKCSEKLKVQNYLPAKDELDLRKDKNKQNFKIVSLFIQIGIIFSIVYITHASFFDYFFSVTNDQDKSTDQMTTLTLPIIPYELPERDYKLIREASDIIEKHLSELDYCHHRIVYKLKKSCRNLNDEELNKLAVMFLNCQLNNEDKPLYKCEENMSLKDCTSQMDHNMWSAYQNVITRTKAICMAVRHDQFRGFSEMIINKLVKTSHDQITSTNNLTDNLENLQQIIELTIEDVNMENKKLHDYQLDTMKISEEHRSLVEKNLHEMIRDNELVKSNNNEILIVIENLREQLNTEMENLEKHHLQSNALNENVNMDLENIHKNIITIVQELDNVNKIIVQQNNKLTKQLHNSIEQLNGINNITQNALKLMKFFENYLNEAYTWINNYVNQDKLQFITLNSIYVLFGMLIMVFINAGPFYRLTFILLTTINLILRFFTEIHYLDLLNLSELLLTIFIAHLIYFYISWKSIINFFTMESTKTDYSIRDNGKFIDDNNNYSGFNKQKKFSTDYRHHVITDRTSRSTIPYQNYYDRYYCTALTDTGHPCYNFALKNAIFCIHHLRNYEKY